MITPEEITIIKEAVQEFLEKMTVAGASFNVQAPALPEAEEVDVTIESPEPQFLIGQDGKTLIDLQRLLRMVLHKKIGRVLYIRLDVNQYRVKKIESVKKMADETADQVALTGQEKALPPMNSYERRIVHAHLALRQDVKTQSQGEGEERHLVISVR